mgnify:CR=1 FL=1
MVGIKVTNLFPDHVIVSLEAGESLFDQLELYREETAEVHHLIELTSLCFLL